MNGSDLPRVRRGQLARVPTRTLRFLFENLPPTITYRQLMRFSSNFGTVEVLKISHETDETNHLEAFLVIQLNVSTATFLINAQQISFSDEQPTVSLLTEEDKTASMECSSQFRIDHLPKNTTEKTVRRFCQNYGTVYSVSIVPAKHAPERFVSAIVEVDLKVTHDEFIVVGQLAIIKKAEIFISEYYQTNPDHYPPDVLVLQILNLPEAITREALREALSSITPFLWLDLLPKLENSEREAYAAFDTDLPSAVFIANLRNIVVLGQTLSFAPRKRFSTQEPKSKEYLNKPLVADDGLSERFQQSTKERRPFQNSYTPKEPNSSALTTVQRIVNGSETELKHTPFNEKCVSKTQKAIEHVSEAQRQCHIDNINSHKLVNRETAQKQVSKTRAEVETAVEDIIRIHHNNQSTIWSQVEHYFAPILVPEANVSTSMSILGVPFNSEPATIHQPETNPTTRKTG